MEAPKVKLWQQIGIQVVDADSEDEQVYIPSPEPSYSSPSRVTGQANISEKRPSEDKGQSITQQKKAMNQSDLGIEIQSCDSELADSPTTPRQIVMRMNMKRNYRCLNEAVRELKMQQNEVKTYITLEKANIVRQLKKQWQGITDQVTNLLDSHKAYAQAKSKGKQCPNCTTTLKMIGNMSIKYQTLEQKYQQKEKELEELRSQLEETPMKNGSQQSLVSKLELNMLKQRGDTIKQLRKDRIQLEEDVKDLENMLTQKDHEIKELELTYRVTLLELKQQIDRINSTYKDKINDIQSEKDKATKQLESVKKSYETLMAQTIQLNELKESDQLTQKRDQNRLIFSFNRNQFTSFRQQANPQGKFKNSLGDISPPTDRTIDEDYRKAFVRRTPKIESKETIQFDSRTEQNRSKSRSVTTNFSPTRSYGQLPNFNGNRKPITHSTKVNKTLYVPPLSNAGQAFTKLQQLKQNVRRELKRNYYK